MAAVLLPLRWMNRVRCPRFDVEVLDVGTEGFGDPQPVQRQQTRERMVASAAETGLNEERTELVAVQPEGGGPVVLPRSTYVCGRVAFDQPFLGAVFVEAADRRQAASDRGAGFAF